MSAMTDNVRQAIIQLVPASIVNDITCYVFYDNHPRDEKNIDILVCTKMGEAREYFQRDLVSSVDLETTTRLTDVKILRNSKCELFYLVAGGEELTILSRKDHLEIHQILNSVARYDISDSACSGQPTLKVICKNSEIPLTPDDNFENFTPLNFSPSFGLPKNEESLPVIINHLMRKLVEAKYSVKCNEQCLNELLKMRQAVAFSSYKKIHPNLDESVFKDGLKLANALQISTQKPWIKTCNKKIVVAFSVCNRNEEALENVHILLHGTTKLSIEYTTKIFKRSHNPPYWNETTAQVLKPDIEYAIVTVIDYEELKHNVITKMQFNGVIFYTKDDKECILPIDDVRLSSSEVMGQDFDVLCSDPMDPNIMLAILASTEKTDLIMRRLDTDPILKRSTEQSLTLDIFIKYLQMEQVPNTENIVIHRKSPYHVLNGVMVVSDIVKQEKKNQLAVTVYSRCPSQVLALIHHIHDAVPFAVVTTTPDQKITALNDSLSMYNESTIPDRGPTQNYVNYASSVLNRTKLVLQYLDSSVIQMSETKNLALQAKLGTEIDLFAQGEAVFKEFKEKMREEAAKGVKILYDDLESVAVPDEMCVDNIE
ncbi:uncharacterized protein LOC142979836 [Anticarsia gemmatalis]|uniref:uncharacterized protein LOC142979836 n=1 Tax=Anticarsia gemmatalis TaxID=129554 RepID=UPI003F769E7E